MPNRPTVDTMLRLIEALTNLRDRMLALESEHEADIDGVAPMHRASARNLLHYLSLRGSDVRDLQEPLARLGLSSLGRAESHVLATMNAVLAALHGLMRSPVPSALQVPPPVDHSDGARRIDRNADALLGEPSDGRRVRIMVTAPDEIATDLGKACELLHSGADLVRINAAHGDASVWEAMAANVREAARRAGRSCRILFDLAGPKLRTGTLATTEDVVHWKPKRDRRGRVVQPARLALRPLDAPEPRLEPGRIDLPLDRELLDAAELGDRIELVDTRGKRREGTIVPPATGEWYDAESHAGAFVESGMPVNLVRDDRVVATGRLGRLRPKPRPIKLFVGDRLVITDEGELGHPGERDASGAFSRPPRIPCSLGAVMRDVKPGEAIWFDDGKIGGIVEEESSGELKVRITAAPPEGARLGADKGINLPDSALTTAGLTAKDEEDLAFAVEHADLVGMSFVRTPQDIRRMLGELKARHADRLGLVLKIETRRAFENLPRLLLAGLDHHSVGIMVARGDLAVEIGFDRLAEVQEEILWVSEAAHVPVIWATQVLESLTKYGTPSRAEVTDAAMSGRAECVMLNKGPNLVEAVRFLNDVLVRMKGHQTKKVALLRRLSVSTLSPRPAVAPSGLDQASSASRQTANG